MAQAAKMGADVTTREARRSRNSGHVCAKCSREITVGELVMVEQMALDERGRARRTRTPYHRGCY